MKNRKLAVIIVAVFVATLCLLGACAKEKQLEAPNISFQGSLLKWDAIEHATEYIVNVNDIEYPITDNFFDMTLFTKVGTYTVKVKALSSEKKYLESEYSTAKTHTVGSGGVVKLDAPTQLKLKNNRLEFSAVSGATKYSVNFGTIFFGETLEPYLDITFPEDGNYALMVKALGAPRFIDSDFSSTLHVTVVNGNVVKSKFITPTGLYIENRTLKWLPIEGVSAYIVSINGVDQLPVAGNSYSLMEIANPSNLSLRVKSVGDSEYADSSFSTAVYYPYVLSSLKNVEAIGDTITWLENNDASGYEVTINGKTVIVNEPKYIVDKLTDGVKLVKIRAVGDGVYYQNSLYTEEFFFNVLGGKITPHVLETPEGLRTANNELRWNSVPYAKGYVVVINGAEKPTTELSMILPSISESHVIKVKAVGNGGNIMDSPYTSEKSINPYAEDFTYVEFPTELRVDNGVLKWSMHASQYYGEVNVKNLITNEITNFKGNKDNYNLSELADGKYILKVKFNVTDVNHIALYSKEIIYEKPSKEIVRLNTPTGLTVENGSLKWNAVSKATLYEVYLDGIVFKVTNETLIDISTIATGKMMAFAVRAKSESLVSNLSAELGYQPELGYNGDQSNPILIFTEADFLRMPERVDAYYLLKNDITLTGALTTFYEEQYPFSGNFDGGGFTVNGVILKGNSEGIFGHIGKNATIKNVTFANVTTQNLTSDVFGVLGVVNRGVISGVTIRMNVEKTAFGQSGGNFAGVIAVNYGTIKELNIDGDVSVAGATLANGENQNIGYVNAVNYGYIDCSASGTLSISGSGYVGAAVAGVSAKNFGFITLNSDYGALNINIDVTKSNMLVGGVVAKAQKQQNGEDSRVLVVTVPTINIVAKGVDNIYHIGGLVAENYGLLLGDDKVTGNNVNAITIKLGGTNLANIAALVTINRNTVGDIMVGEVKISSEATKPMGITNSISESHSEFAFDIMLVGMVGVNCKKLSNCYIGDIDISSNNTSVRTAVAGVSSINIGQIEQCYIRNYKASSDVKENLAFNVGVVANLNKGSDGSVINVEVVSAVISCVSSDAQKNIAYGINDNYGRIENIDIKSLVVNIDGGKNISAIGKLNSGFTLYNEGKIVDVNVPKVQMNVNSSVNMRNSTITGIAVENLGSIENIFVGLAIKGSNLYIDSSLDVYGVAKRNLGIISKGNIGLAITDFDGYINVSSIVGENNKDAKVEGVGVALNIDLKKAYGGKYHLIAENNQGKIDEILLSGSLFISEDVEYINADTNGIYKVFAFDNNVGVANQTNIDVLKTYAAEADSSLWSAYPFGADSETMVSNLGINTVVDFNARGKVVTNIKDVGIFGSNYLAYSLPIFFGYNSSYFTSDIYGNISITGSGTGGKLWVYLPNGNGDILYKEVALKIHDYDGVSGKGTELEPYIIKTASQYYSMMQRPQAYYKLDNNIILTQSAMLKGDFKGQLDGNGKQLIIDSVANESDSIFENVAGGKICNLNIIYKKGLTISGARDYAGLAKKLTAGKVENVSIDYEGLEIVYSGTAGSFSGIVASMDDKSTISKSYVLTNTTLKLRQNSMGDSISTVEFAGLVGENKGNISSSYFAGKIDVVEDKTSYVNHMRLKLNQICGYNSGSINDVFSSARVFTVADKTNSYMVGDNSGSINNLLYYGMIDTLGYDNMKLCGVNTSSSATNYYYHESARHIDNSDKENYSSFDKSSSLATFDSSVWTKDAVSGVYTLASVGGQNVQYAPSDSVSIDIFANDYLNVLLSKQSPYNVVFVNFSFNEIDNEYIKLTKSGFFTAKKVGQTTVTGFCGLATFTVNVNLYTSLTGGGSSSNPYLINTQAELESIHRFNGYFKLNSDIKYTLETKPIGSIDKPFNGVLDGNGKKIIDAQVSSVDNLCGLFGVLGATAVIENLQIENIVLLIKASSGSISTVAGGFAGIAKNGATLQNSTIINLSVKCYGYVSLAPFVGRVGDGESITISNSSCKNILIKHGISYVNEKYAVCNGSATIINSVAEYKIESIDNVFIMSGMMNIEHQLKKYVTELPPDFGSNITYTIEPIDAKGWKIDANGNILSGSTTQTELNFIFVVSDGVRSVHYTMTMMLTDMRADFDFESGSGTTNDPFIINSVGQFGQLKDEKYLKYVFALNGNIDMSGATIDNLSAFNFTYFDGRGYSLNNLKLTVAGAARDVAIFNGLTGSQFVNLVVEAPVLDINFTGTPLADKVNIGILTTKNNATLENIKINNAIVKIQSTTPYLFGGICAVNLRKIENSSVSMTYNATSNVIAEQIGVVTGQNLGDVNYCEVLPTTNVTITNATDVAVGGLTALTNDIDYLGNRIRGIYSISGTKAIFGGIYAIDDRASGTSGGLGVKNCTVDIELITVVTNLTAGGIGGFTNVDVDKDRYSSCAISVKDTITKGEITNIGSLFGEMIVKDYAVDEVAMVNISDIRCFGLNDATDGKFENTILGKLTGKLLSDALLAQRGNEENPEVPLDYDFYETVKYLLSYDDIINKDSYPVIVEPDFTYDPWIGFVFDGVTVPYYVKVQN